VIHRYWHGDQAPPAEPWLRSVLRQLHPRVPVKDWTDDTLAADLFDRLADDPLGVNPRHRSNVARWWLLHRFGGIWLDHDVIPLRPLPAGTWTAALRISRTGCAVALPAGHPLAEAMLEAIATSPRTAGSQAVNVSGDRLLEAVAHRWPDLAMHPLPFDAVGAPVAGAEPWAVHLWSTSSQVRLLPTTGGR
jgi:mannosyltransferase OCH1-like enzyme